MHQQQKSNSELANFIFDKIEIKRRRPWKGEEEVRIAYVSALEDGLNIHFDAERIRKDSSYNNLIIEFKAPGFFKGTKSSAKFIEATEKRLLRYIKRESKKTKVPEEDFIGIAIDGEHICFAQVKEGKIITQHLLPFSPYSINLIVQAVQANFRRALTTDNLLYDFGHGSANGVGLMQSLTNALSNELSHSKNTKVRMLFEEWKSLYGQVSEMSVLHKNQIEEEIQIKWHGKSEDSLSGRLFVIHTYNSLLIKLIAAEIVSAHDLSTIVQPAQMMSSIPEDHLLADELLNKIEHAEIFRQAGIEGFIEEVIFSWYIDLYDNGIEGKEVFSAIRDLLVSVSLYRTDRLTNTRDVLRDLYQGLVPGRLRQSLGEYYTPDWLIDFTINKAKDGEWLNKRLLDPTCGSGAFLVSIIREKIKEASHRNINDVQLIKNLCTTIWGFDLNPLAVQTARVNFLIEIAPLLKRCPGLEIEIPILLADAIYSPAPDPYGDEEIVKYQIGSQIAGLDIHLPTELAFDRVHLDKVFALMGENVTRNLNYNSSENILITSGILSEQEAEKWKVSLEYTYNQILDLHRKQWNGIWFRIVRNFFWSATAGQFDVIIGNPPWVRWSKLPEQYRIRVKPTCEQYDIFSENKRHGGNELDISAMITYTTADKWLKQDGRLAFVITGTLFKNPSSAGFRKFQLKGDNYLSVKEVDDLKTIKPFVDAANHTTVMIIDKTNSPTKYPVPYYIWEKKGNRKRINVDTELSEVLSRINSLNYEAAPVDKVGSPWAILQKGRFPILKSLSGVSNYYEGRKGITTDLNGVYFVPILQNNTKYVEIKSRPEAGKKKIGSSKKCWIEPDILYPLIKGAGDFESCFLKIDKRSAKDRLYVLVPNKGIGKNEYWQSDNSLNSPNLSKTKSWFNSYKSLLEERSTYRRQMSGAPFFAIYNVGEYTFKPWKVIWPEMSSKFYAAVAGNTKVPLTGNKPYIPDHKIYYCSFDSKEEAYFLCGLLNSEMVIEWIESHNISIQVGNIFKHLTLPTYDKKNISHVNFSKLVEKAHSIIQKDKRQVVLQQIKIEGENIITSNLKPKKWVKQKTKTGD